MFDIILASKSKVRLNILNKNNVVCSAKPSNVDEDEIKISMLKDGASPKDCLLYTSPSPRDPE